MKFIIILILLSSSFQQSIAKNEKKLFADTLSFNYIKGRIVIPVKVNGYDLHLVFDTGSNDNAIFEDKIKGLKVVAKSSARGFNNELVSSDITEVNFEFNNIKEKLYAPIVKATKSLSEDFDGILGFVWIRNLGYSVKLDSQTKKMIITNIPHFFDKEQNFSLKIKYLDSYYGIPSINLKLSPGIKLHDVIFDTGYSGDLKIGENDLDKITSSKKGIMFNKQFVRKKEMDIGSLSFYKSILTKVFSIDKLEFANNVFYNYPAISVEGPSVLGSSILEKGRFIFPSKGKVLFFQPSYSK